MTIKEKEIMIKNICMMLVDEFKLVAHFDFTCDHIHPTIFKVVFTKYTHPGVEAEMVFNLDVFEGFDEKGEVVRSMKEYIDEKFKLRSEYFFKERAMSSVADFMSSIRDIEQRKNRPVIKKVIFNAPATIVFWRDGSKTVVKAQDGDMFDKEKGLAMAYLKKIYGNTGRYCELFKQFI